MFSHCSALETVVIGDNAKSIGEHAFEGCTVLKNISIGKSVEKIDSCAIYLCPELTEIVLPESLKTLGGFMGCDKLLNVTILSRDCEIKYIGGSPMMMIPITEPGEPSAEPIHAVTLYGYRNSTTQEYAENNKYRFVPLDPEPETTGTTDVSATTAIAGTGSADTDTTPVMTAVTVPREEVTSHTGTAQMISSPFTDVPRTVATRNTATAVAVQVTTAVQNTSPTAVAVKVTTTQNTAATAVAVKVTTTAELAATTTKPITTTDKPVITTSKPVTTTTTEKPTTTTTEKPTTITTTTTEKSTTTTTTITEKPDTTTTTEQTATTQPVTTKPVIDTPVSADLGDVNSDGVVDSSDASDVLMIYAQTSTGGDEVT